MSSRLSSFICHDGSASTHLTGGCKRLVYISEQKIDSKSGPRCVVLVHEELAEKLSKGSIIRRQLIDMKI